MTTNDENLIIQSSANNKPVNGNLGTTARPCVYNQTILFTIDLHPSVKDRLIFINQLLRHQYPTVRKPSGKISPNLKVKGAFTRTTGHFNVLNTI